MADVADWFGVGRRLRKVVAVPPRDPLKSFTDRSIAVLIPGIDERTIAAACIDKKNHVDWKNAAPGKRWRNAGADSLLQHIS